MQNVSQQEEKMVTELILKKMESIKTTEQYVRNTSRELGMLQNQFDKMKDKAYILRIQQVCDD